jgi:hypothetical protein
MNSLYGRFGMSPHFENHSIIDADSLDFFIDRFDVLDYKKLSNNKLLISFNDNKNNKDLNKIKKDRLISVSVSIASAITSYARIFMSKFKNNPDFKLYYSDTDSLFVEGTISDNFIGKSLGQFKLENTYKKAIFLAPKVYAAIKENGEEISKVKGLKNRVPFSVFDELLYKNNKDSIKYNQNK